MCWLSSSQHDTQQDTQGWPAKLNSLCGCQLLGGTQLWMSMTLLWAAAGSALLRRPIQCQHSYCKALPRGREHGTRQQDGLRTRCVHRPLFDAGLIQQAPIALIAGCLEADVHVRQSCSLGRKQVMVDTCLQKPLAIGKGCICTAADQLCCVLQSTSHPVPQSRLLFSTNYPASASCMAEREHCCPATSSTHLNII